MERGRGSLEETEEGEELEKRWRGVKEKKVEEEQVSVNNGKANRVRLESDAWGLAFRRSRVMQGKRFHWCGGTEGAWGG